MAQQIKPELTKQIIELLTPYLTAEERHAYIDPWCISYSNLYEQIDWTGADRIFTRRIVPLFLRYGLVEPDKSALECLLESVREDTGLEDQARIDAIMSALNAIIPANPNRMVKGSVPTSFLADIIEEHSHNETRKSWKNLSWISTLLVIVVVLFYGLRTMNALNENQGNLCRIVEVNFFREILNCTRSEAIANATNDLPIFPTATVQLVSNSVLPSPTSTPFISTEQAEGFNPGQSDSEYIPIEGTNQSDQSIQVTSARNAVDNIVVTTGKPYKYEPCTKGDTLWSDRSATIVELESQYHGMWCIKFANDDKDFSGANYAEFDLKTRALFVLLEDGRVRNNDTVDWLEEAGFSKSQDIVEDSAGDLPYLEIWKCKANPGRKVIGGPKHRGGAGGQSNWVLGVILLDNNANTNYKECSYENTTAQPTPIAPANIVFVKPDGNGNGTQSNPYGSIQTAINAAHPGQTVHLLDGSYYESIKTVRHGTTNARIMISGDTGAILRGAANSVHIIQVHHDYITIEGFTINGHDGTGNAKGDYRDKLLYVVALEGSVRRGPQYLTVRNMRFLNAGGECLRLKYFVEYAQIYLNHFENCGLYDFRFDDGGKNGAAIYVGTSDDQWSRNASDYGLTDDPDASNRNWIFTNTFITNGNECIEFKEGTQYNVAYSNSCTGQLDSGSAGISSRGNNNIIRDNIIFGNSGAGIRVGGDNDLGGYDHQIYRNHIYNNDNGGIKFQDHPQGQFVCENDFSQGQTSPSVGSFDDEYESLVSASCASSLASSYGYANAPDD